MKHRATITIIYIRRERKLTKRMTLLICAKKGFGVKTNSHNR
jgi:hypothetical protein